MTAQKDWELIYKDLLSGDTGSCKNKDPQKLRLQTPKIQTPWQTLYFILIWNVLNNFLAFGLP